MKFLNPDQLWVLKFLENGSISYGSPDLMDALKITENNLIGSNISSYLDTNIAPSNLWDWMISHMGEKEEIFMPFPWSLPDGTIWTLSQLMPQYNTEGKKSGWYWIHRGTTQSEVEAILPLFNQLKQGNLL